MKASKVALMTGPGALPLTHRHYIALLACSALKCPTIAKTQVAIWHLSDIFFFMEYTCSFNIKFNKKPLGGGFSWSRGRPHVATRRGSNPSEKARLRQQVSKSIQKKQKYKVLLFNMLIICAMNILHVVNFLFHSVMADTPWLLTQHHIRVNTFTELCLSMV